MLTKDDLRAIERIIDTKLKSALQDFFETLILPYFEHNESDHKEMMRRFDENDKEHDRIFRMLEKNQDEHDEMFQRFDRIESHVKNNEKRVKRLEAVTAS